LIAGKFDLRPLNPNRPIEEGALYTSIDIGGGENRTKNSGEKGVDLTFTYA